MSEAEEAEFHELKDYAIKKGWSVPNFTDPHPKDAWLRYWQAKLYEEKHPGSGVPIPPPVSRFPT